MYTSALRKILVSPWKRDAVTNKSAREASRNSCAANYDPGYFSNAGSSENEGLKSNIFDGADANSEVQSRFLLPK